MIEWQAVMVERSPSEMAPLELNIELQKVFESIPFKTSYDFDRAEEELERYFPPDPLEVYQFQYDFEEVLSVREDEEIPPEDQLALERLEDLLTFSLGTSSFSEYICDLYKRTVVSSKENDFPSSILAKKLFAILDKDVTQTGGIFESARVKDIERMAYKQTLSEHLYLQQLLNDSVGFGFRTRDDFSDKEGRLWEFFTYREELLGKWRGDYLLVYKDEP